MIVRVVTQHEDVHYQQKLVHLPACWEVSHATPTLQAAE